MERSSGFDDRLGSQWQVVSPNWSDRLLLPGIPSQEDTLKQPGSESPQITNTKYLMHFCSFGPLKGDLDFWKHRAEEYTLQVNSRRSNSTQWKHKIKFSKRDFAISTTHEERDRMCVCVLCTVHRVVQSRKYGFNCQFPWIYALCPCKKKFHFCSGGIKLFQSQQSREQIRSHSSQLTAVRVTIYHSSQDRRQELHTILNLTHIFNLTSFILECVMCHR